MANGSADFMINIGARDDGLLAYLRQLKQELGSLSLPVAQFQNQTPQQNVAILGQFEALLRQREAVARGKTGLGAGSPELANINRVMDRLLQIMPGLQNLGPQIAQRAIGGPAQSASARGAAPLAITPAAEGLARVYREAEQEGLGLLRAIRKQRNVTERSVTDAERLNALARAPIVQRLAIAAPTRAQASALPALGGPGGLQNQIARADAETDRLQLNTAKTRLSMAQKESKAVEADARGPRAYLGPGGPRVPIAPPFFGPGTTPFALKPYSRSTLGAEAAEREKYFQASRPFELVTRAPRPGESSAEHRARVLALDAEQKAEAEASKARAEAATRAGSFGVFPGGRPGLNGALNRTQGLEANKILSDYYANQHLALSKDFDQVLKDYHAEQEAIARLPRQLPPQPPPLPALKPPQPFRFPIASPISPIGPPPGPGLSAGYRPFGALPPGWPRPPITAPFYGPGREIFALGRVPSPFPAVHWPDPNSYIERNALPGSDAYTRAIGKGNFRDDIYAQHSPSITERYSAANEHVLDFDPAKHEANRRRELIAQLRAQIIADVQAMYTGIFGGLQLPKPPLPPTETGRALLTRYAGLPKAPAPYFPEHLTGLAALDYYDKADAAALPPAPPPPLAIGAGKAEGQWLAVAKVADEITTATAVKASRIRSALGRALAAISSPIPGVTTAEGDRLRAQLPPPPLELAPPRPRTGVLARIGRIAAVPPFALAGTDLANGVLVSEGARVRAIERFNATQRRDLLGPGTQPRLGPVGTPPSLGPVLALETRAGQLSLQAANTSLVRAQEAVDFNKDMTATYHDHQKQQAAIAKFDALADDQLVAVYHGTSEASARALQESKTVRGDAVQDGGRYAGQRTGANAGLYVAPTYHDALNYGPVVVRSLVPKSVIQPSQEIGEGASAGRAFMNTSAGAVIPPGVQLSQVEIAKSFGAWETLAIRANEDAVEIGKALAIRDANVKEFQLAAAKLQASAAPAITTAGTPYTFAPIALGPGPDYAAERKRIQAEQDAANARAYANRPFAQAGTGPTLGGRPLFGSVFQATPGSTSYTGYQPPPTPPPKAKSNYQPIDPLKLAQDAQDRIDAGRTSRDAERAYTEAILKQHRQANSYYRRGGPPGGLPPGPPGTPGGPPYDPIRDQGRTQADRTKINTLVSAVEKEILSTDKDYLKALQSLTRSTKLIAADQAERLSKDKEYRQARVREINADAADKAALSKALAKDTAPNKQRRKDIIATEESDAKDEAALAKERAANNEIAKRKAQTAKYKQISDNKQSQALLDLGPKYAEEKAQGDLNRRQLAAQATIAAGPLTAEQLADPTTSARRKQLSALAANVIAQEGEAEAIAQRTRSTRQLAALQRTDVKLEGELQAAKQRQAANIRAVTAASLKNDKAYAIVRANTVLDEREQAKLLKRTVREEAAKRGLGGGLRGLIGNTRVNDYGPSAGIPTGIGAFFAQGLRSSVQYGVPAAALYGSISLLKEGFTAAFDLQKQFALIQSQFELAFGSNAKAKLKDFKSAIFDIARETGVSASELATVGLQLEAAFRGKQGFKDNNGVATGGSQFVEDSIRNAAKLSAVTGLSAAEITNSLTAIALAFKATPEQIGDVTLRLQDQFGVLSKELVDFLGDIAPVAQEAGFSLEQIAVIGAKVQQVSGKSGSSLAEAWGRIIPQLQEGKDELLQMAQANEALQTPEFYKAIGTSDPVGILTQLSKHWNEISKTSQQYLITLLGSRREAQALVGLFQGGDFQSALDDLQKNAAGTLQAKFKTVVGTLQVEMAKLREQFKQLVVSLADAGVIEAIETVTGSLLTMMKALSPVIEVIGILAGSLEGFPVKFLTWAAAILIAVKAINALRDAQLGLMALNFAKGLGTGFLKNFGYTAGGTAAGTAAAPVAGAAVKGVFPFFTPAAAAGTAAVVPEVAAVSAAAAAGTAAAVLLPVAAVLGMKLYVDHKVKKDQQAFDKAYDKAMKDYAQKTAKELRDDLIAQGTDLSAFTDAEISKRLREADNRKKGGGGGFFSYKNPFTSHGPDKDLAAQDAEFTLAYQKSQQEKYQNIFDAQELNAPGLLKDIQNNPEIARQITERLKPKTKSSRGHFGYGKNPLAKETEYVYADDQYVQDYVNSLTTTDIDDLLEKAVKGHGKEMEDAKFILDLLQRNTSGINTLNKTALQKAAAKSNATYSELRGRYDVGEIGIDTLRASFGVSSEGYKKALAEALANQPTPAGPGLTGNLAGPVGNDGKEVVQGPKAIYDGLNKLVRDQISAENAEMQLLEAEFDAGIISEATYVQSLKDAIAQKIALAEQFEKDFGVKPPQFLIDIANAQKKLNQRYVDAADRAATLRSELRSLHGGRTDADSGPGIDADIADASALLKDPEYTKDNDATLKTAKRLRDLLIKKRQFLASQAKDATEKQKILDEEVPLPDFVAAPLATEFIDAESSTQTTVIGKFFANVQSVLGATFVNEGKKLAAVALLKKGGLQAYKKLIEDQIVELNKLVALGIFDAQVLESIGKAYGILDQIGGLETYLASIDLSTYSAGGSGTGSSAEDTAKKIADAYENLARAQVEGNPVALAELNQRLAQKHIDEAKDEADAVNAQAEKIRADTALQDALNAVSDSRIRLLIAYANVAGDDVEVARLTWQAAHKHAQDVLDKFSKGQAGEAEVNDAVAADATAAKGYRDSITNDALDENDFLYSIGKKSKAQFKTTLKQILAGTEVNSDLWRQITKQLYDLDHAATGGDLQFNLPTTFKLPTLYTARRITQAGGVNPAFSATGAAGAVSNDNRIVTITLNVTNGMTQQQATDLVTNAVGSNRNGFSTKIY